MLLDLSSARLAHYKSRARALRADRPGLSHAQALETVAREHGARDWNTLRAGTARKIRLAVGDRVTARYLGQPVAGRVHATGATPDRDKLRLTLHLDAPVDVVIFDSFSSFRQRIHAMIGPEGRTRDTTSDGIPHLEITGWQQAADRPRERARA